MKGLIEGLVAWVRNVSGRDRFESGMQAEIEFHIAAHAEELERRGVAKPEALRQARMKFGAMERYKQEGREVSRWRHFDDLHADLRDALRGLNRDRGFAAVALAVIASVLAANMVLFAFLDAYFLRPLPVEGANRHVELAARDEQGNRRGAFPLDEARRIIAPDNPALDRGYAFSVRRVIVGGRDPKRAYVEVVSPSFFETVRFRLARGRALSSDSSKPPEPAILLSHTGWQRLLAGDPDAVGKAVLVDGMSLTVAGILEEGTGGLEPVTPEFWMLAGAADAGTRGQDASYAVGGFLRGGLSGEQAQAALTTLLRSFDRPAGEPKIREALVEPRTTLLRESREMRPLAVTLLFLFGLVTAVAAANLTSMHLARAMSRRHDLSIRAALGASRGRLVRHLLTEGVLLAAVAAVLAWALSVSSVAAVEGIVFSVVNESGMSMLPITIGPRIVGASFLLALLVGVGCGLVPALQTTGMHRTVVLKREGAWLSGMVTAGRLRGALVVLQVALSLPLLVSAGVLVKSANRAAAADVRFPLGGLIDLRADPPSKELAERLRSLPGIAKVAGMAETPLAGDLGRTRVRFEGQEALSSTNRVDERFLDAMGIPVTKGRTFRPQETLNRAPVALVSEATALKLWPGRNPIGQILEIEEEEAGRYRTHEVVGVTRDVMSSFFFRGLDASLVYLPGSLEGAPALGQILVRVESDTQASLEALKKACVDAGTFCEPFPLRRWLAYQRVPFSVASLIASGLGLLALGLASLGLHGLVRFAVVQRTREFGVRLAIGATRNQILGSVLGESVRRVGLGIALGLPACLSLSAFIMSRIRVRVLETFDPVSYTVVPALLLLAALLASLMPALRAAGTDPIKALRED